jgi:hypothetical protein
MTTKGTLICGILLALGVSGLGGGLNLPAQALPSSEEPAEEVLRREIIVNGRSPLNGEPLSAEEYALLEKELGTAAFAPPLNPRVQELIRLLRIRKIIKTLLPF